MGRKRMNRRAGIAASLAAGVLVLAACGITISQSSQAGVSSPLPPQRELLPDQQVQQVLARFAFGGRPGDAARVRAMGVDRWIALQLHPERIDDRATDRIIASYETLTAARRVRAATDEVQSAKLARAVGSERQLQEVMVDFWENHFSVFAGKGQTRFFLASYERDAIRPHALGKFRDLLGAVAQSPAMLSYLDNWQSAADSDRPTLAPDRALRTAPEVRGPAPPRRMPPAVQPPTTPATTPRRVPSPGQAPVVPRRTPAADAPAGTPRARRATPATRSPAEQRPRRQNGLNENYGRELMELHTLGVDGGYTQNDVIEVARAFTGWTIDPRDDSFVFRPAIHDAGEKTVLGHRLAAGRGIEDGEEVLDILASSPATAHFVARKLVVHFVSDSAPAALVERVAQTYMRTDGDIREMIRTIATSPEFFSRAAYRAKVKTPFELVASALRAMGAAPDTTRRTAAIVGRLGQPIFGRQTPDGWPDRGDAWMNTGAILDRINFGLALADGRIPGASLASWPYTDSLAALDREQQVDGVIATILGGEVSPATRGVLLSGENPMLSKYADSTGVLVSFDDDGAASDGAMSAATGFPTLPPMRPANPHLRRGAPASGAVGAVGTAGAAGLRQVLGLALGAPEFQRR